MGIKVIITGATGMVGEGVLLACLKHTDVQEILLLNRKHVSIKHEKVKELIVPDFLKMTGLADKLTGYDACFFCAGISSVGMKEPEYKKVTYDTTMHIARKLVAVNPNMIFDFVSGAQTDSSEKGKVMWARVKGKTENDLAKLPFKEVYNFRPGLMKPTPGQKNIKSLYKIINFLYPVFIKLFPGHGCDLADVGLAMINSVLKGYKKQTLEVKDIKVLAGK
jgi:nucleoside-diphosphate-sugar epimerase